MRRIEVLGPGCRNCDRLEANAREAVALAAIDGEVVKVTDYRQLMAYGILWGRPRLAIDGRLVSRGRVLSPREIAARLSE